MSDQFRFDIDEAVLIGNCNLVGTVVGRTEYKNANASYLVQRLTKSGRPKEEWWDEGDLTPAAH